MAQTADVRAQAVCLAGAPDVPSVYIDSAVSEVKVFKADGSKVDASRDMLLCPGDEILTGSTGRVAIRFDEKRTVIRLDGNSRTRVLSAGAGEGDVSLLSGVLYFLSSVRRRFQVDTPYLTAGIDGTEALVMVQRSRRLAVAAVRQGVVSAFDRNISRTDPVMVAEGEAAFTSSRHKLQSAPLAELPNTYKELLVVSESAVDWAVHYPPILLVRNVRSRSVRRAVVLLSSGDYDRASAALAAAAGADPASVAALRAIINVGRNRLAEAERWSEAAIKADPEFAPAYVAASYVRQAYGDLQGALELARKATEVAGADAYALARLAELEMTLGDRRAALETANRSLEVAPTPLALFVAGLANLVANDYRTAEQQFTAAVELNAEAALPRLGLGLLYIRRGLRAEGAWQLELALAHDPRRAALRTWLGRAYFDEGLTQKAADQFRLAKAQDPRDPTPYFFSALERVAANRPIEALNDLLAAQERSDARRVIRSERGLAEDAAARGAALGRVFDVLSFDQLAATSGSNAADTDPSNPGAHRFLADFYRSQPGFGIAQTSELLRGQLLSPPSKTPVQPQLGVSDLAILDPTGTSRVTFAEFSPLFDADGLRFDASGLAGTQDTWGFEGAVTGLYRGFSLSLGQFHYQTDGFRANNDLEHDIFNAVTTIALNPELTLFGEYRHRDTEGGDRRLNFDIDNFDPNFRSEVEQDVARFGFHAQPTSTSDVIGVYTWAKLTTDDITSLVFGPINLGDVVTDAEDESQSGQLQYIRHDGALRTVVGGAYIQNDRQVESQFLGIPLPTVNSETEYFSAYTYLYLDLPEQVTWTVGGAVVSYEQSDGGPEIFQFHPKLGAKVELNDYITLRASYVRNLKPDLVSEQLIEPTTVAGFNQFFDAFNGSVLDQVGGRLDVKLDDTFWMGVEAIGRWWDVPIVGAPDAETEEEVYRGYVYAALSEDFALSAEVIHETSTSDVPFDFEIWRTTSVPVTLSYFGESGIFASVGVEFVDHKFSNPGDGGDDRFVTVGATLGYRLPGNAGIISIEVQNLFDESFNFQNRTVRPDLTATPRYAPDRTVVARGTIRF